MTERDQEDFMRDLEEDTDTRSQILLFKTGAPPPTESDMEDDNELPPIPMEELTDMIDNLQIGGEEDE